MIDALPRVRRGPSSAGDLTGVRRVPVLFEGYAVGAAWDEVFTSSVALRPHSAPIVYSGGGSPSLGVTVEVTWLA